MISYIRNYFENANNIIPGDDAVNDIGLKINNINGQIWLGNYKAALDPIFLKDNNIAVIINCSPDIPYIYDILEQDQHKLSKLETFRIPVYDSLLDKDIYLMEQYLKPVIPFLLDKLVTQKKNIFIHCHMGRQRSLCVTVALLYVLVENDIIKLNIKQTKDKSQLMRNVIAYVSEKRPQVCSFGFRCNFKSSLENFFNIKF